MLPKQEIVIDSYKPPTILQDVDLTKRISALEDWALNVDSRIKFFDQKLTILDGLETKIEEYSFKNLQQNLIQILSVGTNSDDLAAKLKHHFDKSYISNAQMEALSREIHEKLINSWKPGIDEDGMRRIVQEYLLAIEKRQMELIVQKVREYVREVETRPETRTDVDLEEVRKLVAGMLEVYDADKTGLVDYALESAGK